MRRYVPLLLVSVALVEFTVMVWVARAIGVGLTIVLLALTFLIGLWLVKLTGLGVFRRFMATSARGRVPRREIVDGAILLVAGALMVVPGFVTTAVALVLLAPPTRALVRARLVDRVTGGLFVGSATAARFGGGQVWDVSSVEVQAERSDDRGADRPEPPSLSP